MVLSIIAAVFTVGIIAVAAIGIAMSPDSYYYRTYTNDGYIYNYNSDHKDYSYAKRKVSCIWWRYDIGALSLSLIFCIRQITGQMHFFQTIAAFWRHTNRKTHVLL